MESERIKRNNDCHTNTKSCSDHWFKFDIFGPPYISMTSQFCFGQGGLRESEFIKSNDDSSAKPKVVL